MALKIDEKYGESLFDRLQTASDFRLLPHESADLVESAKTMAKKLPKKQFVQWLLQSQLPPADGGIRKLGVKESAQLKGGDDGANLLQVSGITSNITFRGGS